MYLTKKQEESFSEAVLTFNISLESAIKWINQNLNPDDVFSEQDLEKWAEADGYEKPE